MPQIKNSCQFITTDQSQCDSRSQDLYNSDSIFADLGIIAGKLG